MSARILRCLDLCEASGLFHLEAIERGRCSAGVLLSPGPLHVAGCKPSVSMYFNEDGVTFSLGGTMPIDADGIAKYAATLTRVAALARECDRVMGGGE